MIYKVLPGLVPMVVDDSLPVVVMDCIHVVVTIVTDPLLVVVAEPLTVFCCCCNDLGGHKREWALAFSRALD